MKMIHSTTLAQGWLEACEHLLAQKPDWIDTTVVLHIDEPTRVRRQDKVVADTLDAFLMSHDKHNHHTVAETIFPGYEYVRRGVDGVFNDYPDELFPRIRKHPHQLRRWGTYAHRLLRRTDREGHEYNPLAELIEKMKQKRPVRAAYEVGLGFGFDLATYDDDEDRAARMASPCLSHLSFKFIADRVHLSVMYRSHYYIQRAYGNLLGLARLQAFVAEQVGATSGPLVCHSTMAVLEHGSAGEWKKSEIPALVAACRAQTTLDVAITAAAQT